MAGVLCMLMCDSCVILCKFIFALYALGTKYLNNIKTEFYLETLITARTNAMPFAMDARMVCAFSQIYVIVTMVIGGKLVN